MIIIYLFAIIVLVFIFLIIKYYEKLPSHIAERIHVIASIVTILSILLAIYVFTSEVCRERHNKIDTYIAKIEALQYELEINYEQRNKLILSGKEDYTTGEIIPGFRYITHSTNSILEEGILTNESLRNKVSVVAQRENDNNRLMEQISQSYYDPIQFLNTKSLTTMKERWQEDMAIVIKHAEDLDTYLPLLIQELEEEKKRIKTSIPTYCSD